MTSHAGVFDDVNHMAALCLSIEAFGRFRDYREWLIAEGNGGEQIVAILSTYVWETCERSLPGVLH